MEKGMQRTSRERYLQDLHLDSAFEAAYLHPGKTVSPDQDFGFIKMVRVFRMIVKLISRKDHRWSNIHKSRRIFAWTRLYMMQPHKRSPTESPFHPPTYNSTIGERRGTSMIRVSTSRRVPHLGKSLVETILSNLVCPLIFPRMVTARSFICDIQVGCSSAREYDLKDAEFPKALNCTDTIWGLECGRLS